MSWLYMFCTGMGALLVWLIHGGHLIAFWSLLGALIVGAIGLTIYAWYEACEADPAVSLHPSDEDDHGGKP